jgi:hypothetical protein
LVKIKNASFKQKNVACGVGVVIRYNPGSFIATCNGPVYYATDANTLEPHDIVEA